MDHLYYEPTIVVHDKLLKELHAPQIISQYWVYTDSLITLFHVFLNIDHLLVNHVR